jgi:hypothetical protein
MIALMMGTVHTSETSVYYNNTYGAISKKAIILIRDSSLTSKAVCAAEE